jgi:hypothetical protein
LETGFEARQGYIGSKNKHQLGCFVLIGLRPLFLSFDDICKPYPRTLVWEAILGKSIAFRSVSLRNRSDKLVLTKSFVVDGNSLMQQIRRGILAAPPLPFRAERHVRSKTSTAPGRLTRHSRNA